LTPDESILDRQYAVPESLQAAHMYLKRIYIENDGPILQLDISPPFDKEGNPRPVVLVGGNGSGKTTLLSKVADALFEAATAHYTDVVPGMSPVSHNWFRIAGGATISLGKPGGFSLLQFEHNGATFLFKEKVGKVPPTDAAERLPESLKAAASWAEQGSIKEFAIPDESAGKIFEEGVYVFFPSSRSEVPHWLNQESVPVADFDLSARFTKRLRKPIFLEENIRRFEQWLLSVILESRHDISLSVKDGAVAPILRGNVEMSFAAGTALALANTVLQAILDQDDAQFVWLGRRNNVKLGIAVGAEVVSPSLASLSAGQSTLLGMFGTILRYGDYGMKTPILSSKQIAGLCIVDEIDAHLHVDLQFRALPRLVDLFPKMQFLVSSHSPLFVLGMEKKFGSEGVLIVDMPSGSAIPSEGYSEFGRALEVLQETKAFAAAVESAASSPGKLLILLEGETDPIYFRAAVELTGRGDLLDEVEFSWVGSREEKGGQSFLTGKDALNQALLVFRSKPDLIKRRVVLLYDSDANKQDADFDNVFIRSLPKNAENTIVEAGVENMLPASVFTEGFFVTVEKKKPDGTRTTVTSISKMKLCKYLCDEKREPADFEKFIVILEIIEQLCVGREAAADETSTP
jgi:hypothetical protein